MIEIPETIGLAAAQAAAKISDLRQGDDHGLFTTMFVRAVATGRMLVAAGRESVCLTSSLMGDVDIATAISLGLPEMLRQSMMPELTRFGRQIVPVIALIGRFTPRSIAQEERDRRKAFANLMETMLNVNTQAATGQRDYLVYDASGPVKR